MGIMPSRGDNAQPVGIMPSPWGQPWAAWAGSSGSRSWALGQGGCWKMGTGEALAGEHTPAARGCVRTAVL